MRSRTVAVVFALVTGCGSFTAGDPPVADDAGAADASAADASVAEASAADASGEDAGDPARGPLPSPQDCVERGTSVLDERFDVLPAPGWTKVDPQNLLILDKDAEDVVSTPTSFRAGITPQVSGNNSGLIQRALRQSFAETICVTFQGRLLVQGLFGTTGSSSATIAGVDLGASDGAGGSAPSRASVALVVGTDGLRLRVQDKSAPPIAYGNDVVFQRWTIVIARAARKVAFWIGTNDVSLPLEMPFTPDTASFSFGINATGQVPTVIFHMDDLRVTLLP